MANCIRWIQKNIDHKGLQGKRFDPFLCFSVNMLAKVTRPLLPCSALCPDPRGERDTPCPRLVPKPRKVRSLIILHYYIITLVYIQGTSWQRLRPWLFGNANIFVLVWNYITTRKNMETCPARAFHTLHLVLLSQTLAFCHRFPNMKPCCHTFPNYHTLSYFHNQKP